ncbi:ABC transporter ATP-binding protein [Comamonadaceae bacterium G21597-S1]|nr:ABC transporter ATP-binding protein [Comamonadaceae bacterium G21597-S1]
MSELLEIRDLSIALPAGADRSLAVENLSLRVRRGQTLCVVGESGSGKSLAAAAIVRLLPSAALRITAGQVLFDGRDTLAMNTDELLAIRGGRIGYVFQDPLSCLNPLERVGVQVREVLDRHGWPGDRHQRVQEMLADVGLPSPDTLVHKYPWQLSGGQRQRVMIAIALAADPALVIADEPTTALDVTTQAQILRLLREMQAKRNLGLLLITHDFGVVSEMADEVAVLKDGRLVEYGPRDAVLRDPQQDYTRRLLAAVPPLTPRALRTAAEPLLVATGLGKTWHTRGGLWRRGTSTHAVADVALTVGRGETVAVVGESGSGKSTLARLLVRLTDADHGTARLEGLGDDYLALPEHALAPLRRAVQMVFQDPFASLNPRHTVGESIAMGPIANGTPRAQALDEARALLARVKVDPKAADRYPNEFSGGQRQRIVIARALAMHPRLLVADEPVSALDVSVQAEILELLEEIQARDGVGMVFITHDLRVASRMADRILVMSKGRVVEQGDARALLTDPQHPYTCELLAAVPRIETTPAALAPMSGHN